jgi:hypothetical protein
MKKTTISSVARYIAAQPKERRAALERVRRIIRRAIPGAEEGISYKIPAYKLQGRAVIYFDSLSVRRTCSRHADRAHREVSRQGRIEATEGEGGVEEAVVASKKSKQGTAFRPSPASNPYASGARLLRVVALICKSNPFGVVV